MNMYYAKKSEATEQINVINWCKWNEARYPALKLIFHIPNGGSRNKLEAANLKQQGVKAGVPDLMLPIPSGKYHGMFIEMKFGKNKVTNFQSEWIRELSLQNYKCEVCYSASEAINIIQEYLNIK